MTLLAVGFLILVGLGACAPSGTYLETEVVAALRADSQVVDLGSEVPGPWDRLCVAVPYTTQERLDELLGFSWHRAAAATGIEMVDRATLLVFTSSDHVVGYAMVLRVAGDFAAARDNYCLPRSEAIFRVQVTADGWRQLLPLGEDPVLAFYLTQDEQLTRTEPREFQGRRIYLERHPVLSDHDLVGVDADLGEGGVILDVELRPHATERLRRITRDNIGREMAILFNSSIVGVPVIRAEIGGRAQMLIPASSDAEAQRILELIRARWPSD